MMVQMNLISCHAKQLWESGAGCLVNISQGSEVVVAGCVVLGQRIPSRSWSSQTLARKAGRGPDDLHTKIHTMVKVLHEKALLECEEKREDIVDDKTWSTTDYFQKAQTRILFKRKAVK